MRERFVQLAPYLAGATAAVIAVAAVATLIGVGGSHPGAEARNPFVVPHRAPGEKGPLGTLIGGKPSVVPSPTIVPSPTASSSVSVTPSPTVTVSPSPSPTGTTSP